MIKSHRESTFSFKCLLLLHICPRKIQDIVVCSFCICYSLHVTDVGHTSDRTELFSWAVMLHTRYNYELKADAHIVIFSPLTDTSARQKKAWQTKAAMLRETQRGGCDVFMRVWLLQTVNEKEATVYLRQTRATATSRTREMCDSSPPRHTANMSS